MTIPKPNEQRTLIKTVDSNIQKFVAIRSDPSIKIISGFRADLSEFGSANLPILRRKIANMRYLQA